MWWLAIFLAQDMHVSQDVHAQQSQRVRTAMAASLEKQRASVEQQIKFIKSPVPPVLITPPLFTVPPPASYACDPVAQPELTKMIENVSREQSVDPALVREVARQESGFRPCAVSPKGAEGLMQLMPATAELLKAKDPLDPAQNIEAGASYLKQMLTRFKGDVRLALAAY